MAIEKSQFFLGHALVIKNPRVGHNSKGYTVHLCYINFHIGKKNHELITDYFSRADEAEKLRKDLEHATNFTEEQIEKLEADLRLSKKTMRETHEKYDETGKRIAVKERKYEMAKESAEQKEKREKELEQALADLARKMANMESSREKIGKKEEHNKNQLKKLSLMLKEAEHRAELKEDEQQKMELVISQMNEEQEIYKKMRQQKHAALSSKT